MSTLPDKLTCGNGHTFAVPGEADFDEEIPCPDCGDAVLVQQPGAPRSTSKGRSLWAVMQGSSEETDQKQSEINPEPKSEAPAAKPKWNVVASSENEPAESDSNSIESEELDGSYDKSIDAAGSSEEERPRGLWAMMGQGPQTELPEEFSSADEATSGNSENDEGASLEELLDGNEDFEVRETSDGRVATSRNDSNDGIANSQTTESPANQEETDQEESEDELLNDDVDEEDGWEVEEYDEDDAEAVPAASLVGPPIDEPAEEGPVVNPGAKTAMLSLGFGIAGFLFAALNLLPDFWAKIPSTVAGLGALVWGYQSLNESKRSVDAAKLKLKASVGLACGLVGMFAGPLALNAIGDGWREEQLRGAITKNLNGIGEGVEVFYEHHGAFPRATYVVDGNADVPMHSWMSALLPHMGYDKLALGIDRKKPYNDPANFEAMSTIVPTFLVPNVDHQPTLRGLATAHFAGVGGETLTDAGRVDVGVFSRGMTITRDVISDGASQTMLAGEITRALPAWGEPGNWRTIGRGLNRQVSGFGNSAGTGAHFLMADGSVKFFPNSTSRDVLVRLSTRNGGDPVSVPE